MGCSIDSFYLQKYDYLMDFLLQGKEAHVEILVVILLQAVMRFWGSEPSSMMHTWITYVSHAFVGQTQGHNLLRVPKRIVLLQA